VTKLHLVGAMLPAVIADKTPLGDPKLEPLYATAERLNVPLAIHGAPQTGLGLETLRRFIDAHTLSHPVPIFTQFVNMVFAGLFQRYPGLRVAYLEAGAGWVPYFLDRMDYEVEAFKALKEWPYTELPSDVVRNGNVYVSFEAGERSLPDVVRRFGPEHILYASDFPHELSYEEYAEDIEEFSERDDLSDDAKRKILAENSARFYGLEPVEATTESVAVSAH
jgi:predicted TIM-barrel fold metal-dependent hydrolase